MKFLNMVIGLLLGALIWALSPQITGQIEPWDGQWRYYFGSLFLSGFLSALPCPRHFWLGTIGVYAGQFIYIIIARGGGNLLPLGMLIGVIFALAALAGGFVTFGGWLGCKAAMSFIRKR